MYKKYLFYYYKPSKKYSSRDTFPLTVQSCGIWQFGTHVYPLLYSSLLTAIVYHAFILLYMDHTGKYEAG
jgi:hypothetical protein